MGVVPGVPNFALGCTRPRAQVPGLSIGGAPLVGAGYVGGPAGPYNYANVAAGLPYLGTPQPRIWYSYAAANTGNIDTTYANGPNFARNDVFGFSITGVYNLTDTMTLKSISGYRQIKWNIGTDLDGTPETLQEVTDAQHQWQMSQEFQLLGKAFDNKLNYVTGLYYFKEAGYVHDYVPFEGLLYVYDQSNDAVNENYAAFVHGDYAVTDHWGVTAGGRYHEDQGELSRRPERPEQLPVLSAPMASPRAPTAYCGTFPRSGQPEWHIFDPTLGIQYHFNTDLMAYASWGKGFKAGGWTTRLSAVIPSPKAAEYSPEYSKTWELGLKSEWFDHRLRANAAVFYTDYNGIQLNIQQGISPVYTNAGNAKIKGAELELQVLVGGGLQLNVCRFVHRCVLHLRESEREHPSVCVAGRHDESVPPAPPICARAIRPESRQLDAKLPKTPKYKITIDPEYNYSLPSDATIRLLAAFTYTAEMFNDSLNTPQLRRPPRARSMLDPLHLARTLCTTLRFGGTNLTNDRYVTAGSPNYGAGEVGGLLQPPGSGTVSSRVNFEP